jgi:integrase
MQPSIGTCWRSCQAKLRRRSAITGERCASCALSSARCPPEAVDAGVAYDYLDLRGRNSKVRANREIALLSHVITMAVRWKVLKANPLYRLQKHKETPRVREVRPDEVMAWYRFAGSTLAAYTCLKLLVGLRKGDMLRLERGWWTDEGLYSPARKNGKRFLFERTPALAHAVERVLSLQPIGKRFLFETRNRKPYIDEEGDTSGFDSIWQRRIVRFSLAGHERFTEHDLRSKAGDDAEAAGRAGHRLLGNTEAQFRRAYQRRTQRVQPVR